MSETFTTCSDCNRCLRTEDGPTCPGCLALRLAATPAATFGEGLPTDHPAADDPPEPAQSDVVLELHSIDGSSEQVSA